eukprot:526033_1
MAQAEFLTMKKKAKFLIRTNQLIKAKETIVKMLNLDIDRHIMCSKLGDVCRWLFDYTESKSWYEKSIKLDPCNMTFLFKLSRLYFEINEFDSANKIMKKIKNFNSKFHQEDFYFLMGKIKVKNKLFEEGIFWFSKCTLKLACIYYYRGLGYLGLEQYDDAIKNFSEAVSIEPLIIKYHVACGRALYSAGNHEQCKQRFKHAIKLSNKDYNIIAEFLLLFDYVWFKINIESIHRKSYRAYLLYYYENWVE